MFFDWIKAYQDYDYDLPQVGDVITRRFDAETEALLSTSVPAVFAEGSYCTESLVQPVTSDTSPAICPSPEPT
jgi:hypothetical protein